MIELIAIMGSTTNITKINLYIKDNKTKFNPRPMAKKNFIKISQK